MSGESFHLDVSGSGNKVDIMPAVQLALATCPFKHDLTEQELAQLTAQGMHGRYIPVDVQDRVEDRRLHWLISRIVRWSSWPERRDQITHPSIRRMRPYIELRTDLEGCAKAQAMKGRWLQVDELEALPFRDCVEERCWCHYRTLSRRDLERAARM